MIGSNAPHNPYDFQGVEQKPPPTSYQRNNLQSRAQLTTAMRGALPPGTAGGERLGTAIASNKSAGYAGTQLRGKGFDPLGSGKSGVPQGLQKKEQTEEENYKSIEREVNKFIEESADAKVQGNLTVMLEKAKEATSKERQLRRMREQAGLVDQINIDLTYAVCFNLANAYQANGMYQEAINAYTLIVKNKQYPQAGRLRVNMGNISFEQKKYGMAIKMYRMALDMIPHTNKEMRVKIMKNIGHSFVKQGQFQDAVQHYENVMKSLPDFQTGFNLMLCYYATGNKELMKSCFVEMLSIEIMNKEEGEDNILEPEEKQVKNDALSEYLKEEKGKAQKYITEAAKLIAPVIEHDIFAGFDWIIEHLKNANYPTIESEMEIAKAVHYIKKKEFEKAIEVFKSFEKKDQIMMAKAANNISFLYFLERDYKNAEKWADMAIKNDRYNAKALVNKGNCLYIADELDRAKELYLEAIGVEADCVEAIFNLGLVYKKLGYVNEALQAFEKLQTIVPSSPEVIYQLAHVNELIGISRQALKWYHILITKVPSDAGVLAKMGGLYQREEDEIQALHFYLESYRFLPVKIDVISWLGIQYVKNELYEKAVTYFERASQIQSSEVKWKLMVASCYRRMNSYQQALKLYEEINQEHPDNIECLRYLVSICKDLGMKYDNYSMQLKKLERVQELQQPRMNPNMEMDEDNFQYAMPQQQVRPAYNEYGNDDLDGMSPGSIGQVETANKRGGKRVAERREEDDWGDDNMVDDMLPT